MKIILAERDLNAEFSILHFGFEDISANAHWDRGMRNFHIVHYVLSGEGFYNSTKIKAGEGFYIKPGDKCEYHALREKPWRYFWIAFDGNNSDDIAKKYVQTNEKSVFEFDLRSEFLSLVENITADTGTLSAGRALGYFYLLTSYHGKRMETFENRYVEEAKRYMSLNFFLPISIVEVAAAVGVNDRYLYNLFIKHEGVSPKKYLSALRLSRAELMLKSTRLSITEIAEHCGFSDVLAFSRFFSKNKSLSPTKFRDEAL